MPAVLDQLPEIYTRSLYKDKEKPWRWQLTRSVRITLSNGGKIRIPRGFITDFASVPRLLWGVIPTIGDHNLATLVHDYLYVTQYRSDPGRDDERDRLFADKEMLYWLRKSGVSEVKAQAMYGAVRLGGKKWWDKGSHSNTALIKNSNKNHETGRYYQPAAGPQKQCV